MSFARGARHPIAEPLVSPFSVVHGTYAQSEQGTTAPASTSGAVNVGIFSPIFLWEPYLVDRFWMINGATVGTDSFDLGVYRMTDPSTGRLDLLRSIGNTLSAGSANVPQTFTTLRTAGTALTSGSSGVDATSLTTASVTLKAGRVYLLAVTNSKAAAPDAVSTVTGGGTWTSEKTVSFNSVASPTQRLTVFRMVPTSDYTGTIVVDWGANTQTGFGWSLTEYSGVDTTTNNGVVQSVSNTTDSAATLTVTLAAFGATANSTYGAFAKGSTGGFTVGTGFLKPHDVNATPPNQALCSEWKVDNDTTVDISWTGNIGAAGIAVELKADTSALTIPPGWCYLGWSTTGGTMTYFGRVLNKDYHASTGILVSASSTAGGLPSNHTPVRVAISRPVGLYGFANRSLV